MTGKKSMIVLVAGLGLAAVALPLGVMAQDAPAAGAGEGQMAGPMDGHARGGFGADVMFDQLDADADGKVTAEEIAAARQARVTGLDANSDGLISASELAARTMEGMQARADAMAARRIAAQDVDGDGMLSAAELATPPMPVALFDRMDSDKDGAISQAEYDAAKDRMMDRRGDRRTVAMVAAEVTVMAH